MTGDFIPSRRHAVERDYEGESLADWLKRQGNPRKQTTKNKPRTNKETPAATGVPDQHPSKENRS